MVDITPKNRFLPSWGLMAYSVIYTPASLRDIKKLPPEVAVKIAIAINGIKENIYSILKKIKIASSVPIYSFKIGEYRL